MDTLSQSLEDYLEIIYNKFVENDTVRAIDISRALNVSRASVTDALNRLNEKGYINYRRYGHLSITNLGMEKAKQIVELHHELTEFFLNMGIEKEEAEENACKIEHVISSNVQKRIAEFNNFCKKNPDFKF